ncbi:MAG: CotH kinase family protein [Anaerotignum sp.]|nr:CotH kinase family protein [Anaerotignum sp.]
MSNPSAVEEKTEKGNMPEMGNFPAIGGMPEMGDFSAMEGITSFSGGGKPLVDTLLVNEALLARYEDYLREFTEKYLTEEYMAAMVTEIHDLIAPYVEKDATAFYTYEEFEQGCSVDPEDEYSLVYYAVNMAESIQNQLAGGEPTFDASSLKGGGMGFGGGKGGMPAFGGDMKLPEGVELPDGMQFPFEGKMPSFGDGMEFTFGDEMPFDMTQQAEGQKEVTESSAESGQKMPFGKGENGGDRGMPKDMPAGMPGFGGERQPQQIDIREVLPKIAICGGVFCGGFIFVALYKRKKNLK